MPGRATADRIVTIAPTGSDDGNWSSEVDEDVESLPIATIEEWLMDPTPVEEWVPLKTKRMRVKLRGLTELERQDIQRRAPRSMNKKTRQVEADQNWINVELVRTSIVEPHIPNVDMLKKALAGEMAYLGKQIGRISGFDFDGSDALG